MPQQWLGLNCLSRGLQQEAGVSAIAPFTMTTLVTPQLNLIPTPPQVTANNLQPGEIIVMATLDSANVTSTFNLTEMGVFAKSGSGPEVMIAYCQASSPYDSISPGSGSSRLQINEQIPIIVGVGASVSITVQAGNPVFVPPVVAGPGISVAAPTNSAGQVQQYIVSTPTLTVSATLNVAHGNNNVAPNFSSIQNALNYLSQYSIPSNVGMYINVAAGQYTGADAFFDCEHVNGSQITISGPQNGDFNFTAVSGTTGGLVTFYGLSGTTAFTVGFLCVCWYAGSNANGLYDPLLTGCWIVQSKTATTVTVYVPNGAIAGMGTFCHWMVESIVGVDVSYSQRSRTILCGCRDTWNRINSIHGVVTYSTTSCWNNAYSSYDRRCRICVSLWGVGESKCYGSVPCICIIRSIWGCDFLAMWCLGL